MEQLVRVRQTYEDGTAQVVVIRESACSGDCHKCSGCGAQKQTVLFAAVNAIGAKPGELVLIRTESAPVLKGAAVLYLVPLALFFLGYGVGAALWQQGGLTGCLAFVAGIVLAAVYDRKVAARQNAVYTITGYPKDTHTKGDHDLD